MEPRARAAKWAWPLILLSLIGVIAAETLISSTGSETDAPANDSVDLSLLAVLQVQAKMVIAMGWQDPDAARAELRKLEVYGGSDELTAAIAATHGFLGLEDGGEEEVEQLLARRAQAPGADRAFLEEVRRAIVQGVTEEDRQSLRLRLGWFADLPGASGEPGAPPLEDDIRAQAIASLMVMGVVFFSGLLAILTGAALLLFALILKSSGKLRLAFVSTQSPSGVYLESFAIYLASMAAGNLLGGLIHFAAQPVIALGGLGLALFWPKIRGVSWSEARQAMGLHRGRGWLQEIGSGMVGYLMVLPIAVIGISASMLLVWVTKLTKEKAASQAGGDGAVAMEPISHPAVGWLLGGWEVKLLVFGLAAVVAPLLEETFFRGALIRHLRYRFRFVGAALLSGLIFAALHPQGWMGIPALTAMGFSFAMIREWRDSLIAPMTAHAINNGLLIGGLALLLS